MLDGIWMPFRTSAKGIINGELLMENTFIPQNDLEEKLLQAQQGLLSEDDFMKALLDSQVFMPIYEKHRVSNLQTSDKIQALQVEDDNGEPVMILFSSPDRAKLFLMDYPGYGGGLLVELRWIFEKFGTGFGISLNPNWPVGIDLHADMLEQLRLLQ